MTPRLSILIPSLLCRRARLAGLLDALEAQSVGKPVEIIVLSDNGRMTIGEKRNRLFQAAGGEYLCGIDDDDTVSRDYVDSILGELGGTDVVTFDVDWQAGEPFLDWPVSSIEFRPLACVRTKIAQRFTFPDWWQSEDRAYRVWLAAQRPTVRHIPKVLYSYHFKAAKPEYNGNMYAPKTAGMQSRDAVAKVVGAQLT